MTASDGRLSTLLVCSEFSWLSSTRHSRPSGSGGFEEVVKELLGAGADVNAKNDKGLTPLCVTTLQWSILVTLH